MTRRTADFERIEALPRRVLSQHYANECGRELTSQLRVTGSSATLLPWQAVALVEAYVNGGLWAALPVGFGKTLVVFLLMRVLESRCCLIIAPKPVIDSMRQMFVGYIRDWGAPEAVYKIITWSSLSPESGEHVLTNFQPDLIIVDESHKLANRISSASRRVDRYLLAHEATRFCALTGTPSRKSIMTYWHILCWALRERAPVPMHEGEAEQWAAALDDGVFRGGADPGVLGATQKQARAWYRKRLVETPGVLIVDGDSAEGVPLTIKWRIAREDPAMNEIYEQFLTSESHPLLDTEDPLDPLSRWRLDAQFGAGIFRRWKKPPPKDWLDARRAVAAFVRDAIEASTHTRRPLDTKAQVMRYCRDDESVQRWIALRDTFKPETVVEWFTASALEDARAWLGESREPSVVWVGMPDFGKALAKLTGLPYYGESGTNEAGQFLNRADPTRSLIASWNANKEGFNLQAWNRALICQPPQSALYLEQLFGRHHRKGQTRGVTYHVLISSGGGIDAFETAVRESSTVKEREGLTQKLLRARIERATPERTEANAFRWASRSKKPT